MDTPPKDLLGKRVEVLSLRRRGLVTEGPNKKGEYLVALGAVTLWVALSNLKLEISPVGKATKKKRRHTTAYASGGSMKIDLHGFTRSDALEALEKLLDRALLADCSSIEIIHGIGSGVLKAAVLDYCHACSHIARVAEAPGNPGTTIAYLR